MTTPTHRSGHSLDLIITRDLDALVQTPPISDSFLSDHCTVLSERTLRMPATTVKEVCYRKTKAIDIEAFKDFFFLYFNEFFVLKCFTFFLHSDL